MVSPLSFREREREREEQRRGRGGGEKEENRGISRTKQTGINF